MIYIAAALAVVAFVTAFDRLGVVEVARRAIARSGEATASLKDPSLTDEQREVAMRGASVTLISDFASITVRGGLSLVASALPVFLMDLLSLVSFDATMSSLSTWPAIIGISVVIGLWYTVRHRRS